MDFLFASGKGMTMNRTTRVESGYTPDLLPFLTDEELNVLHVAYQRAFDEYSSATSAINDCVRRRMLPTAEEFARKRVAQIALLDARRALWKASRRRPRTH